MHKKLLPHLVGDVGVRQDRFQIALYACHGSLQLVGGVLRQLVFQLVLLFFGGLQLLVDFDDSFGYLAKFIVREGGQLFDFKAFAQGDSLGEGTQLVDAVAYFSCKTGQYKHQDNENTQGEPQVFLLRLQGILQVVSVGQCGADVEAELWQIGGGIEVILAHCGAGSFYVRPLPFG